MTDYECVDNCPHCGSDLTPYPQWGTIIPGRRVCEPCVREVMMMFTCQCPDSYGRLPPAESCDYHRQHRKNCIVVEYLSAPRPTIKSIITTLSECYGLLMLWPSDAVLGKEHAVELCKKIYALKIYPKIL